MERCADIIRVVVTGQYAAPELAEIAREGDRRHRAGAADVVRRVGAAGALRQGVRPEEATTTVAALADFRLALLLIDDYGLDPARVEAWTVTTTRRAVHAP
jgi:hypothetical protein